MGLNLPNYLQRAVTKTMNRTSSQNALAVLFHSSTIGGLSRFFHIVQALTALIVMRAAEIGDYRDKVWVIPLGKKSIHKAKMRACSKPIAGSHIGKPRLDHIPSHTIVPLR